MRVMAMNCNDRRIKMYKNEFDVAKSSGKVSVAVVAARVVTMVSLIVSAAVLHTNHANFDDGYVYTYKRVFSYKFAFSVALLAFGTNLLCTIQYVAMKKLHLTNSSGLLKLCFYVDKTAAILVAAGGGAALCATVDLKRVKWNEYNSEKQDFLSVNYVAAAFLLLGCISSLASSIHSSLALTSPT